MQMKSWLLSLAAAGLVFGATGSAFAQATCENDDDCPGPECGGQVCQWPARQCEAAGSMDAGVDGWCTDDSDCKCRAVGATCAYPYCTFTLAPGTTGAGGTSASTPTEPAADEGGCSMSRAPSNGLAAFGVAIGVGALAFGLRRRRS